MTSVIVGAPVITVKVSVEVAAVEVVLVIEVLVVDVGVIGVVLEVVATDD